MRLGLGALPSRAACTPGPRPALHASPFQRPQRSAGMDKVTPRLPWAGGREAGPSPRPGRRGCSHSWQLGTAGPHPRCGRAGAAERSPEVGPAMARDRPPGRGCSPLSRCLLGAALLLGLRLCAELRRTGPRPPARSAPPRPPAPHLPPAPGPARGASRRQVTYVRSGRRAPPGGGGSGTLETGCCAPRGRPGRKVSGKRAVWGSRRHPPSPPPAGPCARASPAVPPGPSGSLSPALLRAAPLVRRSRQRSGAEQRPRVFHEGLLAAPVCRPRGHAGRRTESCFSLTFE